MFPAEYCQVASSFQIVRGMAARTLKMINYRGKEGNREGVFQKNKWDKRLKEDRIP